MCRVWKRFDFEVMRSLANQGLISDPRGKSESVRLTHEGLARAKALLHDLERGAALPSGGHARVRPVDEAGKAQLSLFVPANEAQQGPSEVERTLAELDVDRMTPLDALVALSRLKALLHERE